MRRFLVVVVVVLLLVVGVTVVADRVLHSRTEARLTEQVSEEVQTDGEPEVTVHGVPFLTQVLAERLDRVSLRVDGVRVEELALVDVSAEAHGVGTQDPHTAERVTAQGTVPLDVIEDLVSDAGAGLDLEVGTSGDLLELTAELLGAPVGLRVLPVAAGDRIDLELQEVLFAGRSVAPADLGVESVDDLRVPLPGLPEGLQLTDVWVREEGARVELTGEGVDLGTLAG